MHYFKTLARVVFSATFLVTGAASASETCTDMFKDERFTLMVPNKAGGGYDTYARTLAPVFEALSGASMIVTNAPAAGGFVGIGQMANAAPEENLLGLFGTTKVFGLGDKSVPPSAMQPMGAFAIDRHGWIAKKGTSLDDVVGKEVVGASSTIVTALVPQVLVGRTIGASVKLVPGYKGSGAQNTAVLRGEVDFTSRTLQSSWLQKKSGDFDLLFTITDSAVEEFGSAPYLAGKGGLVDQYTTGKPAAERDKAMEEAQLAVTLTQHMRAVFATSAIQGERRTCLADLVYQAIGSADFIEPMNAAGRPVDPMDQAAAIAFFDQLGAAYDTVSPLLAELQNEMNN